MDDTDFLIEHLPRRRRTLRIAIITEAYPPASNEIAATAARLVEGLRRRGHEIQLARARRHRDDGAGGAEGLEEVLTPGIPIPRRPDLKLGLPATQALARLWGRSRPDVVYVFTQGPLGWSALRAARRLRLPAVSEFQAPSANPTNGAGWLGKPLLAYLRKFHNRALWTFVATEAQCAELTALGFRNLRVVDRHRWDLALKHLETLLEIAAGVGPVSRAASGGRRPRTAAPQGA